MYFQITAWIYLWSVSDFDLKQSSLNYEKITEQKKKFINAVGKSRHILVCRCGYKFISRIYLGFPCIETGDTRRESWFSNKSNNINM